MQNVTTSPPALLPILRSEAQARLLTRLLLDPERTWTVSELAVAASVSQPTATREIRRIASTGVITVGGTRSGRQVRVDPAALLYPDLRGLVLKAFGPLPVLRRRLAHVPGIDAAWIYGSWARRYGGQEGAPAVDIDLLVVGVPEMDALSDAVGDAGEELGREVNPTVLSSAEWAEASTGFVRGVRDGHRVAVVGVE